MVDVDSYLKSPPSWAAGSTGELYEEAMKKLGLRMGSNPSRLCPLGGHGESTDGNVVAYANGVMCFSHHGFIPRDKVIESAGLQDTSGGRSISDWARHEVGRFVAQDQVENFLAHLIETQLGWTDHQQRVAANVLLCWAICDRGGDTFWKERFDVIFGGRYPQQAREFVSPVGLVHRPARVLSDISTMNEQRRPTYIFDNFDVREKPGKTLAGKLAPNLVAIDVRNQSRKAVSTANIDRFIAGEQNAIARSSLTAVDPHDRPVPDAKARWVLPAGPFELPKKVTPVVVLSTGPDADCDRKVHRFLDDFREVLAFEDEKDFGRAVAYFVQPMLIPLMPGQFPGYLWQGPTKSGKTFASQAVPRFLFCHPAGQSVLATRMPKNDYEMHVQSSALGGVLYVVFDECVDFDETQLKVLDHLVTAEEIVSRRLYVGYQKTPNLFTFSILAVRMVLPPETEGRLLSITLTESRPNEIASFFRRWHGEGPDLLKGLFNIVRSVDLSDEIDVVPDRRPGFGILRKMLREGFSLDCNFEIRASANEIIDLICRAHSLGAGTVRNGGWRRISLREFAALYQDDTGRRPSRDTLVQKLTAALGYRSTRQHPIYREGGYPAEDGGCYEIEIREESDGRRGTRTGIFIRPCPCKEPAAPTAVTTDADEKAGDNAGKDKDTPNENAPEATSDSENEHVVMSTDALEAELFGEDE